MTPEEALKMVWTLERVTTPEESPMIVPVVKRMGPVERTCTSPLLAEITVGSLLRVTVPLERPMMVPVVSRTGPEDKVCTSPEDAETTWIPAVV